MSDPAYPYASNPVSAQDPYSQQSPYGQAASAPYGQPEVPYAQPEAAYGVPNGTVYGQPSPVYAQPYYATSNLVAYADLRSQAQIVMVLAGVSFLTLYVLLSIPAMVWSFTLCTKAKDLDAPPEIVSLTNTARIVTSICAAIQTLVPLALLVAYFLSAR
ncbi:MAG: hypothetical protein E7C13_06345 [Actinomyces sp.]|nr:hypothetical protein [Actinomyces sp.]